MKRTEFYNWLVDNQIYAKKKYCSDYASRAKRVETLLQAAIPGFEGLDTEYKNDKGTRVVGLLARMGNNDEIKKYPPTGLPVGSRQMCCLQAAVKKYFVFLESIDD